MRSLTAPRRSFRAIVWASAASALIGLAACDGMNNREPNPQYFPKPDDPSDPAVHPGDIQPDPGAAN